jgi:two-component system, OmpR family, sensor kinase
MIFKSIKWRLQIWYGLILVVVLAGFGITAYQLERGRVLRKVDDELGMRLHIIADAVHPPPHGPAPGRPPFNHPPGQPSEGGPENELPPPLEGFQLPSWAEHFFGTNENKGFYFVVSSRDGKEMARRGNIPIKISARYNNYFSLVNHLSGIKQAKPIPVWTDDGYREIFDGSPSSESILVGRSLAPEIKELRFTALSLLAVGGLILLVGLFGGWWLVTRAIRPIEDISAAAVKISAGDLSQRIDIADTESELGQLASVLNSTFARLEARLPSSNNSPPTTRTSCARPSP